MKKALVLASMIASMAGATYYCAYRSECSPFDRGLKGEIRRAADGKTQYFDGRCWTATPMPPTDTPF
jgi:hypothetical protein